VLVFVLDFIPDFIGFIIYSKVAIHCQITITWGNQAPKFSRKPFIYIFFLYCHNQAFCGLSLNQMSKHLMTSLKLIQSIKYIWSIIFWNLLINQSLVQSPSGKNKTHTVMQSISLLAQVVGTRQTVQEAVKARRGILSKMHNCSQIT
jgi:hypothetical protein